jgi:ATP-dependent RNA circularization protein (DNA/RNA ligase family)
MEGSSMTVYHDIETIGVTSRNIDLKMDQEGNTFVDVAKASGLIDALNVLMLFSDYGRVAIRGELLGPGIQENIYQYATHKYHIYDVWVNGRYLTPEERVDFIETNLVPYANPDVVQYARTLFIAVPAEMHVEDIVAMATGESEYFPTLREGIVFKSQILDYNNDVFSFKAISPEYLLKEAA